MKGRPIHANASTMRVTLLAFMIGSGKNLSTKEPPSSMKKTVGMPLTAMTALTAKGSTVTISTRRLQTLTQTETRCVSH